MVENQAADRMWTSLEHDRAMPQSQDIKYLSGLLNEGIQRLEKTWPHLSVEVRRELTLTLKNLAEADFEMDFFAVFRIGLQDVDADVRADAIEGLFEDQDVRLVSQFVQLLQEDQASQVRAKAAQALANFVLLGELQKIRPRPFFKAREALRHTYHNSQEDLEVRRRAIEALAYTNLDNVEDLIADAYAHSHQNMRISAVFAMGRSADKRWAAIVQQELNNPNPAMRYEATRACGELRLQETTAALVELADDVDPEIQQMALWSLGQIGGKRAERTLNRYIHSDDEALSLAAKHALAELEFFHGDLSSFFGPPAEFDGEGDEWDTPGYEEEDFDEAFL